MKQIHLSKRMEAVVNMVSPQSFAIADIGCDHAYVSIALAQAKPGRKVLAMDVRTGPLQIARTNVEAFGMLEHIELRLSDGMEQLKPGEVDTVILAGMGGLLMVGILERGRAVLEYEKKPELILQPQSDIPEVRKFLYAHGYCIEEEDMLIEEGKYYTLMRGTPKKLQESAYDQLEWLYGRKNLERRGEIFLSYLEKEEKTLKSLYHRLKKGMEAGKEISPKTMERLGQVEQEIRWNQLALEYDR